MSTIYVQIKDHPGEAPTRAGTYKGQIACSAIRHAVLVPVVSGPTRTLGDANNGPIALTHMVDKASPKLKSSAMNGNDVGEVVITRVSMIAGNTVPVETITLGGEVYVVRVDVETPIVQATLELSDELMETFYLSYTSIKWSHDQYDGNTKKGTIEGQFPAATA